MKTKEQLDLEIQINFDILWKQMTENKIRDEDQLAIISRDELKKLLEDVYYLAYCKGAVNNV